MENKHREPILYIVGNQERAEEICHIVEDEWGGYNNIGNTYAYNNLAYYINKYGRVNTISPDSIILAKAVANGWMKEYKLPERPQFKPFDKVIVRPKNCKSVWTANYFSHDDGEYTTFVGGVMAITENCYILPYNEQTAKLIGTRDEWKGGNDE